MALKTELEDMSSHHRNTSTEHINLIKAVTESIKHLKEHQQSMSDMEVFKDIMPNILMYFHAVNQILSSRLQESSDGHPSLGMKENTSTDFQSKQIDSQEFSGMFNQSSNKQEKVMLLNAHILVKKIEQSLVKNREPTKGVQKISVSSKDKLMFK